MPRILQSYADLGTNTFHHIIIERYQGGNYKILDYRVRFVKLMSGGIQVMEPEAKKRAFQALQEFKSLISEYQIHQAGWFATEGLRSLDSSREFRDEVAEHLGINIQLISGDEEAKFISSSLAKCAPNNSFLGFDLGGGSTELIYHSPSQQFSSSYKMGAAVLFNTFHKSEPIAPTEIFETEQYCNAFIDQFLTQITNCSPEVLIGASGSLDSVLELLYFPRTETEIFSNNLFIEINYSEFKQVYQQVIQASLSERLSLNGMNQKRAEMMSSALIAVNTLWKRFPNLPLRISRFSLLMALVNTTAPTQVI